MNTKVTTLEPDKLKAVDMRFGNLRIVVSNLCTRPQKVELRKGICSAKFTSEFNKWLAERFGFEYEMVRVYDTLYVHADIMERLQRLK